MANSNNINNSNEDISNKELLELIRQAREKEEPVVVLTGKEVDDLRHLLQNKEILHQIAEDRKAFGRVFTWLLYVLGGIAGLLTAYATIGENITKMFKGS